MISLTGLLIQSSPSYTPVCPGDTVIFTCSSTTGYVYWSLDSDGTNNRGYLSITTLGIIQHLGIFTFNLTSKSPQPYINSYCTQCHYQPKLVLTFTVQ